MEHNLTKNHVLSQYAVLMDDKWEKSKVKVNGPTKITETMEISDVDEMMNISLKEPTGLTHSIEESDPDEFIVNGITLETRGSETSDPDEMYMGPTKHTFTIETSDEDEFLWI